MTTVITRKTVKLEGNIIDFGDFGDDAGDDAIVTIHIIIGNFRQLIASARVENRINADEKLSQMIDTISKQFNKEYPKTKL